MPARETLASYLFFTATGEEFDPKAAKRKEHFIGTSRLYDVFLLYTEDPEKLKGLALTLDVANALRGIGITHIRQIDRTYDVAKMRDTIREALTTPEKGPKVIVASSECMLNKQRREKPLTQKAIKEGRRVEAPRFGVDEAICTGDHACIRLSGCPSLSLKRLDDPLRDDPVASIDQSCVGCGNCGEVADAAILCPSFYRADVVHNPGRWERRFANFRSRFIHWLQHRREARRLTFGPAE